jgi:putative two-component system response regulator
MATKQKILIVDDEPANLALLRQILKNDYDLAFAKSGADALNTILKQKPELVLLDVMMPGMDGYAVCGRIKADPRSSDIPVIFCTAMVDEVDEVKGFSLGAADYITKPVRPAVVLARVRTQLALSDQNRAFQQRIDVIHADLLESRLKALQMLGRAAEFKDNETGLHVIRMSHYAQLLARADGWNEDECRILLNAAPMHDIGKIGTPDQILLKPGRLTAPEIEIMKGHCETGARIIGEHEGVSRLFEMARIIALTHHEKWDGSGYPAGLAGEAIPIEGRIVAIADVFDALTSKRPYKEAWSLEKTVDYFQQQAGRHFDPVLVALFQEILPQAQDVMQLWQDR